MTGNPRLNEELILINQIQPIKFSRELAATEQHTPPYAPGATKVQSVQVP